ncbi:hypothetical protein C7212DRAFT_307711 [Tuber magnatum]|uniref:Uncharacterized protein n=1 Tax=Tuber magnatum TaxID=42249 RepID=A0A317SZS5_9PEZI|nr:hypothetical protein C7212DRAFT_307711 [Tuber magnatum]
MDSTLHSQQTQATNRQQGEQERVVSCDYFFVGNSGITWIKTRPTQPPDPSFDTTHHKRITHALLTHCGRSELIPTPTPDNIDSINALQDHENMESVKRIERNRLLYPDRLSDVEETVFMTARKKAVVPTHLRKHIAGLYHSVGGRNIDLVVDESDLNDRVGVGKLRLFRLGGDRPGQPRHRLDLWSNQVYPSY